MKNFLKSLTSFLITTVTVLLVYQYFGFQPFDIRNSLDFTTVELDSWLNLTSNSYFGWAFNPILTSLLSFSQLPQMPLITALALGVFAAGLNMIFSGNLGRSFANAQFNSIATALLVFLFFGSNIVVIQSMAFFPWIIFSGYRLNSESIATVANKALLVLVTCLLVLSAQQLSLVVAATGLIIARYLRHAPIVQSQNQIIFLICLAITSIPLFTDYAPVLPDYPALSHVVPDDGIPGNISPLVGSVPAIPVIDRQSVRTTLKLPALILFGLFAILFALRICRSNLSKFGLFLAMCLVLDVFFIEYISQISPVATLARLVPGLFYFSLSALTFALGLFVFVLCLAEREEITANVITAATLLIVIVIAVKRLPNVPYGILESTSKMGAYKEFTATLSKDKQTLLLPFLVSPSYTILNHFGIEFALKAKDLIAHQPVTPDPSTVEIETSSQHKDLIRNLFDNRARSRWSEQTGKQKGNEWILLKFNNPIALNGIELDTGEFAADFPRGLRIESSDSCTEPSWQLLFDRPSWQGSLEYSAKGFPHFSAQHKVQVVFPKTVNLQCLKVSQIGKSNAFDWSVAELRLFQ